MDTYKKEEEPYKKEEEPYKIEEQLYKKEEEPYKEEKKDDPYQAYKPEYNETYYYSTPPPWYKPDKYYKPTEPPNAEPAPMPDPLKPYEKASSILTLRVFTWTNFSETLLQRLYFYYLETWAI